MSIGEPLETTSDERVMAALSHFFGLIAALIVWATQKDKSRFVRFQALQALAFDMLFMVLYMFFMLCTLTVLFLGMTVFVANSVQAAPGDNLFPGMMFGMFMPFGMFACIMPLALAAMAVRIVAAVSVATGHNFRYPWIAGRVEAFLKEPAPAA